MKITLDELIQNPESVSIGQKIYLSGTIYTARDAVHKRLIEMLPAGEGLAKQEGEGSLSPLPFNLKNSTIYYCGPTPTKPGSIIGACGPTTSSRMDTFTPRLLDEGVKVLIGKGSRSPEVVKSIAQNKAIYLVATGGIAALLSKTVVKSELVAFKDLGPEAIYKLEVKDMPLIIAIDSNGNKIL